MYIIFGTTVAKFEEVVRYNDYTSPEFNSKEIDKIVQKSYVSPMGCSYMGLLLLSEETQKHGA